MILSFKPLCNNVKETVLGKYRESTERTHDPEASCFDGVTFDMPPQVLLLLKHYNETCKLIAN